MSACSEKTSSQPRTVPVSLRSCRAQHAKIGKVTLRKGRVGVVPTRVMASKALWRPSRCAPDKPSPSTSRDGPPRTGSATTRPAAQGAFCSSAYGSGLVPVACDGRVLRGIVITRFALQERASAKAIFAATEIDEHELGRSHVRSELGSERRSHVAHRREDAHDEGNGRRDALGRAIVRQDRAHRERVLADGMATPSARQSSVPMARTASNSRASSPGRQGHLMRQNLLWVGPGHQAGGWSGGR